MAEQTIDEDAAWTASLESALEGAQRRMRFHAKWDASAVLRGYGRDDKSTADVVGGDEFHAGDSLSGGFIHSAEHQFACLGEPELNRLRFTVLGHVKDQLVTAFAPSISQCDRH